MRIGYECIRPVLNVYVTATVLIDKQIIFHKVKTSLTEFYDLFFVFQLDKIDHRLISVEQGFSLFYEKHSAQKIVQLLNNTYLIDIQDLDRRILSSHQSKEMHVFFQFVATHPGRTSTAVNCVKWSYLIVLYRHDDRIDRSGDMQQDYSHRWNQVNHIIALSLCPKINRIQSIRIWPIKQNQPEKQKQIDSISNEINEYRGLSRSMFNMHRFQVLSMPIPL